VLGNRIYQIQVYSDLPFTVWDIDNNRQLNARFLENDGSPVQDGLWDPSDAANGDREAAWVDSTGYTGVVDSTYFNDPTLADMLQNNLPLWYEIFPARDEPGGRSCGGGQDLAAQLRPVDCE
jgi:hypothetical protein